MKSRYPHLLAPVQIGKLVLKNRIIASNSLPHYFQGPESYPNEQILQHISNTAKNGAAIVTFLDWSDPNQRIEGTDDGKHFPMYDLSDPSVLNYISQLADGIHYYNSKAAIVPRFFGPMGYYVTSAPAVAPGFVSILRCGTYGFRGSQQFNLFPYGFPPYASRQLLVRGGHRLPLTFRTGVVIAVTLQEVDRTPHAQASAQGHHEGLKHTNSRIKDPLIKSEGP